MPDAFLISFEGETLKEMDGAWRPDRHYVACFQPQAWINDHAVDVDLEGPQAWDVTHFMGEGNLSEAMRSAMLKNNSDASDELKGAPAAPAWVKAHAGPFVISVSAYVDAVSAQVAVDALNGTAPAPEPAVAPRRPSP